MNTKMLHCAKKPFQRQFKENWIFQEDNDPKHTAKLNKELIQKKGIGHLN